MRLKRRVSLDWAELDEIDPAILIQGVEPAAGKETVNSVSLWGGTGSRITGEHRDFLDVVVKFSLDIKRDRYRERSEIFDRVMAWAARGGWLRLSQKPDRKLRVYAAQLPSEGDPLEWTNRYSITFRANGVPYWQRETPNGLILTGGTAEGILSVPGSRETVLDFTFHNGGSTSVTALTVTAGTTSLTLADLALAPGETLTVDHEDTGRRCVLRIRITGTGGAVRSAYACRTPGSSDELTVAPGLRTLSLAATGGTGTLRAGCNGRFV